MTASHLRPPAETHPASLDGGGTVWGAQLRAWQPQRWAEGKVRNLFHCTSQGGIGPAGLASEDLHVLDFTDFDKPRWHRSVV